MKAKDLHLNSYSILIVEDDQGLLRLIQKNISRIGVSCHGASNGASAIQFLKQTIPDLMLLDYQLSDMNSKQLVQVIEKMELQIPFIIMTGHGDEHIAVDLMKLGAMDYLIKDSAFLELLPSVVTQVFEKIGFQKEIKAAWEENARFAAVLDQIHESVIILNQIRIIQYVNPAFSVLSGYSSDEIIGKTTSILRSDRHSEEFYEEIWQTISNGNVWKGQVVNKKKNGVLFIMDTSISPVKDYNGTIINYVSVSRDITDDLELKEKLRQAQKMEAIGTLAGGIAHDFNNILFPIFGFTQMIIDELPKNSPFQSMLNQILKAASRAKELVKQILTFSHRNERELKPIHIEPIYKETIKLLRATIPTSIDIQYKTETCDMILADSTEIHQILMNLCTNAYHAMKDTGGKIIFSIKNVEINDQNALKYAIPKDKYVQISVQDNGHGMEKDVINHMFEPYFTTKEKGKGTGLGLAVVHGIVEAHKGYIHVESTPNVGTTFYIFFPIISSGVASIVHSQNNVSPGGNEHILLVDDEEMIVKVVSSILTNLGYAVTSTTSSLDALEIFQKQPEQFDLVITDMTMPKLTGKKFAKAVLDIRPDIPVILCTGFNDSLTEEEAQTMGIRAYIMKPILKTEMAVTIRDVLNGKECFSFR